ncbi:MAG: hypothetical protein ACI4V1_03770 [Eubacteriales bacterium]
MSNFEVTFTVASGTAAVGSAIVFTYDEKKLTVQLFYDFRDIPLLLTAPAKSGDTVVLTVRPHRTALRVNGELLDEEWGCGRLAGESDRFVSGDFPLTVAEIAPEDFAGLPAVTRAGISTEELRLPGVNIGDCIPFSDDSAEGDGKYHLFYLYDRHHHGSKWGLGAHQWAHVSTLDCKTWDEHPMAISITEPWEGSICPGSVVRTGDRFYAWYAVRMADGSPAHITYAVSEDNVHFTKSGHFFTLPAAYEPSSARDPKVIALDGTFHMFVTTTRVSSGNGCLAHLTADTADFTSFTDCGAILEWEDGNQPECPDWFAMGDTFYLIYSIHGTARYLYSASPFDGWKKPVEDRIPCGRVPKAARLGEKWIFAGFRTPGEYAGDVVFAEAVQNADKTLKFIPFAKEP